MRPHSTNDRAFRLSASDAFFAGALAGDVAGLTFLVGESILSVALGGSLFAYPRLASSVILGPAALSPYYPLLAATTLGVFLILVVSIAFGAFASLVLARFGRPSAGRLRLIAAGAAGGSLLWATSILAVGTAFLPQTVVIDPLWRGFLGHTVFFGLVFGIVLSRMRKARH